MTTSPFPVVKGDDFTAFTHSRIIRQLEVHHLMASFAPGLFVGGEEADLPKDNLDLERWFRQPKGHERRMYGHRHAGVRLIQEGPTLLLALDAHIAHPEPFTASDLWPYRRMSEGGHASPRNDAPGALQEKTSSFTRRTRT